jgi:hypothetical protein
MAKDLSGRPLSKEGFLLLPGRIIFHNDTFAELFSMIV